MSGKFVGGVLLKVTLMSREGATVQLPECYEDRRNLDPTREHLVFYTVGGGCAAFQRQSTWAVLYERSAPEPELCCAGQCLPFPAAHASADNEPERSDYYDCGNYYGSFKAAVRNQCRLGCA